MKINKTLQEGVDEGVFSGAAAAVFLGSKPSWQEYYFFAGHTSFEPGKVKINRHTMFDLASLTKPLVTTLSLLCLLKEKKIALATPLAELLEEEIPADKEAISIAMLLNHAAGLAAHGEFFKHLEHSQKGTIHHAMRKMVLAEPLVSMPGEAILYSDLGFLLLGWIIEQVSGVSLASLVEKKIYQPLGLAEHLFFPMVESKKCLEKIFVSCEDCLWRQRVICGEVSDENCFVLGGAAGHAGLFGDILGVTGLVSHLLNQWQGREEHPGYTNDDLKQFITRQQDEQKGTWALGFDTPSSSGSSGGKLISPNSIGHLGFTGTSFWIDPVRDAAVVLLTNRVHPSRDNDKIKQFRPRFHDVIWKILDKKG